MKGQDPGPFFLQAVSRTNQVRMTCYWKLDNMPNWRIHHGSSARYRHVLTIAIEHLLRVPCKSDHISWKRTTVFRPLHLGKPQRHRTNKTGELLHSDRRKVCAALETTLRKREERIMSILREWVSYPLNRNNNGLHRMLKIIMVTMVIMIRSTSEHLWVGQNHTERCILLPCHYNKWRSKANSNRFLQVLHV